MVEFGKAYRFKDLCRIILGEEVGEKVIIKHGQLLRIKEKYKLRVVRGWYRVEREIKEDEDITKEEMLFEIFKDNFFLRI